MKNIQVYPLVIFEVKSENTIDFFAKLTKYVQCVSFPDSLILGRNFPGEESPISEACILGVPQPSVYRWSCCCTNILQNQKPFQMPTSTKFILLPTVACEVISGVEDGLTTCRVSRLQLVQPLPTEDKTKGLAAPLAGGEYKGATEI